MRPFKPNRVIFIERPIETKTEHHAPVTAWQLIGTVRAEVLDHSVAESQTAYGEAANDAITFRTRYFSGLTTADRIRFIGRTYNVKGYIELGIRAGLEIKAVATT